MPPAPANLWTALTDRLGEDLLPRLVELASIDPELVRAELEQAGHAFSDPERGRFPELHELDATADTVVASARRSVTLSAVGGSLAGLAGVPPRALADLATRLRLAQRLCIVYGFDPRASRGELLVRRAMYAAYDVPWPEASVVEDEWKNLPALVRERLPEAGQAVRWAAKAAALRVVKSPIRRIMSWIPGLTTSVSAYGARKDLRDDAAKMQAVFRGAWEGGSVEETEEAIEIAAAPNAG